ncbi:Arc family DNA-binding protein [Halothiobacillus sp.]|uniref:Arc family DNA-binding protein n=1 Tax=Halothiobacillus sp. TaxID=1891311 RepID=UPI002AD2285B|nr:Arc family DNA-binding protein [Halothiobacillus sp.]
MNDVQLQAVQLNVRVPAEIRDWLKEKAQEEDRSMNWILVNILESLKKSEEANHGSNSASA